MKKKFLVHGGTTFDVGARAFELASTARLTGGDGAPSFSITNAKTFTADAGSRIDASAAGTDAGAISIASTGACVLNGKIFADSKLSMQAAGNGGSITVDGVGITLGPTSVIEANSAAGHGGAITLLAGGGAFAAAPGSKLSAQGRALPKVTCADDDPVTEAGGSVTINQAADCDLSFKLQVDAATVSEPFCVHGGDGGQVMITCAGALTLDTGAQVVAGTARSSLSGSVAMAAGSVEIQKRAKIQNDGSSQDVAGSASAIAVTAGTTCSVDGKLLSVSVFPYGDGLGVGAAIVLTCPSGVTLGPGSLLDVSAPGVMAGAVTVDSQNGPCDLNGKIAGTGGQHGMGGSVEVDCGTTLDVEPGGVIDASAGGSDGGFGDGVGGEIDLNAGGAMTIAGQLSTRSTGDGGMISAVGLGITTTADSKLDATANLPGGDVSISLTSQNASGATAGDVTIGNDLIARGTGSFINLGGQIDIEGCNVTVEDTGKLSTDGVAAGENDLTAHHQLTINGVVSAHSSDAGSGDGINSLIYRDGATSPGKVAPVTTPEQDGTLSACS